MKTTSLHIAFAALLSLLSFVSCSRNDEVAVAEGEEGKVYVTLTLSINGEEVGSRATWDPEQVTDEEGVGWENEIDDLQILIYDENDTYVGTVEDLFASNNQYVGTLSGTDWQSGTYKFVVLANFTTNNTRLADLASITYNQNAEYIPMWGVLKSNFNFAAGERTDIGSIDLLRAMAKVEVNFAESFPSDYEIGTITISPYNTQGYCLPAGYTSVDATGELDREEAGTAHSFNPLDSPSTNTSQSSIEFKGENKNYYIYLPEYDNSTKPAKIQVTVNGETYELEFKDYENGAPKDETPYNIVRNHIYRYTITGVNDGKLVIQYRAMPWELVTSKIGYAPEPISTTDSPFGSDTEYETFLKNSHHYILLPVEAYSNDYNTTQTLFNHLYENPNTGDNEARLCIVTRPTYDTNKQYIDLKIGSAGARYYFMLTGPEGATWEAHLTNEEDFAFSNSENTDFSENTDEYGNENVRMVTHGIARNKPYIIQIIATHLYTGYDENMSGDVPEEDFPEINKNDWKDYFEDKYLTIWGSDKWNNKKVVETEFYITVKLVDGAEYELTINPSYNENTKIDDKKFPFIEKRRYAGTDTRIWIRQIRAKYGIENLEDLAKDESGVWWKDNQYWNPNHTWK